MDLDLYANAEPMEELRDGTINILFVGRFEERKGLIHLLKAYHRLRKRHVDARLLVIGSGPKTRDTAASSACAKSATWSCWAASARTPRRATSRAPTSSARRPGQESFGIVLLEAMAAGVPIVASDIHGYKQVVQRGVQGLLVEPKNYRALAAALYALSNDADLRHRLGDAGRARAPEYSWDRVTEQIVDFYQEVRDRVLAERATAR